MNDSIERQIARLELPDPPPGFDRRMQALLDSTRDSQLARRGREASALSLAGGSVAAALLLLAIGGQSPRPSTDTIEPAMNRVVVNVDVSIPLFENPAPPVEEDQTLLSADNLVITTSPLEGNEK